MGGCSVRINVEEDEKFEEIEIIIKCNKKDKKIDGLINKILEENKHLLAYKDNKSYFIDSKDIFYVESVDNRVFIYLEKSVLEIKLKLYEFEELLSSKYFFRCNKSTIINIAKISELNPQSNRNIIAIMENQEQVYISRKYVKKLKEVLEDWE